MLDKKLLDELQEFIHTRAVFEKKLMECFEPLEEKVFSHNIIDELDDFIKVHHKPAFTEILFKYIDLKGYKDPDVYKRAGMDRKHFSKIRSHSNYHPKKTTILALSLALELNYEETEEFLDSAGYSLSHSDTTDLVIQFFLEREIYDIHKVNEALHYFSLKTLG